MGRRLAIAALFAALFALPLMTGQSYIRHVVLIAMMYGIVASGWNITLGFGGIFNFAHPAFFAIGAYAAGIAIKTFGIDPVWTPLLGGAMAVAGTAANTEFTAGCRSIVTPGISAAARASSLAMALAWAALRSHRSSCTRATTWAATSRPR